MSEWHQDAFTITTDPARLDLDVIHTLLHEQSYWAQNRSKAVQQKANAGSLCFGLYHGTQQIGFARVVTDYASFAWLCDVIIAPEFRKRGLSKWLVRCITTCDELKGLRRMVLLTKDAHTLYQKYGGFKPQTMPERWLERLGPEGT